MFQFKTFRSQKGFSITEVLIAAGILSIIAVGIATMLENMTIDQKRTQLLGTLRDLKSKIEATIKDQNAWNHTIAHLPAAEDCLRTGAPCSIPTTDPPKLVLYSAAGHVAYDLLAWNDSGSNGFTDAGMPCTGFSPSTGNDQCPISYRLVYTLQCIGASPCSNPQIRITGRLLFRPSSRGMLFRFARFIPQGNINSGYDAANSDDDDRQYDVSVVRTASMLNRNFLLIMGLVSSGAGCALSGAGICNAGSDVASAAAQHPLAFTNEVDNSDLVQLTGVNRRIRFNEVGYYSCTITVSAFATGGFSAGLYNLTVGGPSLVAQGTTVAGLWSSSQAVMETKFHVSNTTDEYIITQRCDAIPSAVPGEPNMNQCSLGMALQPYASTTNIVTMACNRVDRTF